MTAKTEAAEGSMGWRVRFPGGSLTSLFGHCRLLAGGLSYSQGGPLHKLLDCSHCVAGSCPRSKQCERKGKHCIVFYDLAWEVMPHCFCSALLLIRDSAQPVWKGLHKDMNSKKQDHWCLLEGWLAQLVLASLIVSVIFKCSYSRIGLIVFYFNQN